MTESMNGMMKDRKKGGRLEGRANMHVSNVLKDVFLTQAM